MASSPPHKAAGVGITMRALLVGVWGGIPVAGLMIIAIFVLAAHAAGKANDTTALGAAIFFWARVGHLLVYSAGIIYLRTLVFFVGTVGEIMILIQLFR